VITIRKSGGQRSRPVDTTNKWRGSNETNREAESRPHLHGYGQRGEHSRFATDSYYCEPVWWSAIRRFWTNKIDRQTDRCRNRDVKTEQTVAECVPRLEGAGKPVMTTDAQ
jgi:hypothetical protein